MHKLIIGLALALTAFSCAPQCESISRSPQTVCHRADAGVIATNAPFIVEGQFSGGGTCSVAVDGGQINLGVDGMACGNGSADFAPTAPVFIKCTVPGLPAGTYVVNAGSPLTFSVPEAADAGLPNCL